MVEGDWCRRFGWVADIPALMTEAPQSPDFAGTSLLPRESESPTYSRFSKPSWDENPPYKGFGLPPRLGDCAAYSLCPLCKLPTYRVHTNTLPALNTIPLRSIRPPVRLSFASFASFASWPYPCHWAGNNNHNHGILVSRRPRNISPRAFGSCSAATCTAKRDICLHSFLLPAPSWMGSAGWPSGPAFDNDNRHTKVIKAVGLGFCYLRLGAWCSVSVSPDPSSDGFTAIRGCHRTSV
jgi:hypothetical protein